MYGNKNIPRPCTIFKKPQKYIIRWSWKQECINRRSVTEVARQTQGIFLDWYSMYKRTYYQKWDWAFFVLLMSIQSLDSLMNTLHLQVEITSPCRQLVFSHSKLMDLLNSQLEFLTHSLWTAAGVLPSYMTYASLCKSAIEHLIIHKRTMTVQTICT